MASVSRRFALAYVVLVPVYLAPLCVTRFIPAFDLPHHLAIADALTKTHQLDSPYARHFTVGLELAPFIVHFVALRALAEIVSLGVAAKLLVGAVVLALPLSAARLLHASGRDALPALLAFPLAYSMPLHYGFIAFMLALPFLVWMLAVASNEKGWRERRLQSGVTLGVLSLVTFFVHLEAWAVGAVAAAVALLLASVPWRTRIVGLTALAPSVVPCVLYVIRIAHDPQFRDAPSFPRALLAARFQELAGSGVLADVWGRIRVAPIHLLRGFTDGSDVVAARVFFGLIAVAILAGLADRAVHPPRTVPRPRPAGGLIAVGLVAYFGLPHHALPHAYSVYPRFVVVLALLLLLAIPARLSRWPERVQNALAAVVAVLLLLHGVNLARHYGAFGREVADFQQVVDASPAGLASGGLVFDAESRVMNVEGIFTGFPAYYVTERPAPASSTWLYYCTWPQLPCHLRDPDGVPPLPFFSYPSAFDPHRALEDLQLLFVRGGPPADRIFGREMPRVRLLAQRGSWRLFARR